MKLPTQPTAIRCAWCDGQVPPEFTPEALATADDAPGIAIQLTTALVNSLSLGPVLVWCSGRCCRQSFMASLRELVRTALTPTEYDDLTRDAPPEPVQPASLPTLTTTQHIREAIEQVSAHLLANRVTPKQASLLLYAIQTALGVLRIATERPEPETPHHQIGYTTDEQEAVAVCAKCNATIIDTPTPLFLNSNGPLCSRCFSAATAASRSSTAGPATLKQKRSAASASTAMKPKSPARPGASNATTNLTDPRQGKVSQRVSQFKGQR